MGEDAVGLANKAIPKIAQMARSDGKPHDMTVAIDKESAGLTIHATARSDEVASAALRDHCLRRKYLQKASTWYGMCIRPAMSDYDSRRSSLSLDQDLRWMRALHDMVSLDACRVFAQLEQKPKRGEIALSLWQRSKYKKCCLYSDSKDETPMK